MTGLGLNIACYLFLGGAGGGVCLVASILALLTPRESITAVAGSLNGRSCKPVLYANRLYRKLFGPLYACSFALLALGSLILLSDLGVTNRATLLFLSPHPTYITFGAFSLVLCMLISLVLAAAWGLPLRYWRYNVVCILEAGAVLIGFAVVLYTGLLLASTQAVPLWSTPALPFLFTISAASCGCAFSLMVMELSGLHDMFSRVMRRVVAVDAILIVLEAAITAVFIGSAFSSVYEVASESARVLLKGELQSVFVLGFIGLGLVAPFFLEVSELLARRLRGAGLVSSACILAGGLALRYSVVMAGAHPAVWV